jgi:hypothetical protein
MISHLANDGKRFSKNRKNRVLTFLGLSDWGKKSKAQGTHPSGDTETVAIL